MLQMSVTGQWESVTAHGEFVTVHREFCDLHICDWSVGRIDCSQGICDYVTGHRDGDCSQGLDWSLRPTYISVGSYRFCFTLKMPLVAAKRLGRHHTSKLKKQIQIAIQSHSVAPQNHGWVKNILAKYPAPPILGAASAERRRPNR